MPKLWLLSDLHVECYPEGRGLLPAPDFDVLVVAGDIWEGEPGRAIEALVEMSGGRPTVAVLGNHDYWGLDIQDALHRARASAEGTNVHVLDGDTVEVGGLRFCGATLWPDLGREVDSLSPLGEPIRLRGGELREDQVSAMREAQIAALEDSGADVVLTHYPADGVVLSRPPAIWLSGHRHDFERRMVGGTEFIRNPRQARVFADRMVLDVAPRLAVAPVLGDDGGDADFVVR